MNRSSGRTYLLVVVLLVAGCSGLSPETQPTVTITPAPVPSEPAATIDPVSTERTQPVSGHDDPEIVDLVMLGRTHYRTVFSTTYTHREVVEMTAPNGTILTRMVVVAAHNQSSQLVTVQRSDPLTDQQVVRDYFVSNGDTVVERARHGNQTTYRQLTYRQFYNRLDTLPGREVLISHLVAGSRNDVDPQLRQLRSVEGSGRYYLFASRLDRPDRFGAIESVDEPRDLSLWVEVDAAGFIRRYRLLYSAQIGSKQVRISRTVTYSGVGSTTVDRPAWYDRAMANDTSARTSGAAP